MLDKAIRIAATIHERQVDKAGKAYILHPLRVMFAMDTDLEKICAVLHDVIEDSDMTLEVLRNEGFSEEVLSALVALTKRENESYDDFIIRVLFALSFDFHLLPVQEVGDYKPLYYNFDNSLCRGTFH